MSDPKNWDSVKMIVTSEALTIVILNDGSWPRILTHLPLGRWILDQGCFWTGLEL